jgi:hypothetical protein
MDTPSCNLLELYKPPSTSLVPRETMVVTRWLEKEQPSTELSTAHFLLEEPSKEAVKIEGEPSTEAGGS